MDTGVVKEEFTDPSDSCSSDTYSDQDWSSSRPGSASRHGRGFSESTTGLYTSRGSLLSIYVEFYCQAVRC